MDVSKLFKGQKLDLSCPNCDTKIKIDASKAFKKNQSVTCPNCDSTIDLDNNESIKKIEKEIKQFNKMFK